jgi:replicative DNA helicase
MSKELDIPYNESAEISVLGSILIDPDAMTIVNLLPSDFFAETHQLIYSAMCNLYAKRIECNEITVAQELVRINKLDIIGGASYLTDLVLRTPTSVGFESYIKIVKDCAINRRIISASEQIKGIGLCNNEPRQSLEQIQSLIQGIGKTMHDDDLLTPEQWALKGADRYASLSHGIKTSVKTGIEQLDYETGGFFAGEMWILGGYTGTGKSTIATQIANHMQLSGNVLLASLEMNWRGLIDREIASELQVHPRSIRVGNYSDEFYGNIVNALPTIAERNIYILGKGLNIGTSITTNTLYNVAQKMKNTHGLVAIVVDYLQLFADEGKTPYERASIISTRLKQLLEALEVPGLVLSQFSRGNRERSDKRPTIDDFRDSGRISEDSDGALLMYRAEKYPQALAENPDVRGTAELIIAKNRQGDSDITIPLRWNNDRRIYV